MMQNASLKIGFTVIMLLLAVNSRADSYQQEIELLLLKVEESGCIFHRNNSSHSSVEAADHLRMKYGRAKSHIKSVENFIDLIATKSSWTGNVYQIECKGEELQPTGEWLYRLLASRRDNNKLQ